MAQGTDYNGNKNLLLTEGIEQNVFQNGQGLIDGDKNQKALKNLAETFWAPEDGKIYGRKDGQWVEVQGGGADITQFTETDGGSTISITREVVGSNVTFHGTITGPTDNNASEYPLISDIIPQDYLSKKWFSLKRIKTIMNQEPTQGGSNGYLVFNETSSYTNGSAVTDETKLYLPGHTIGTGRTYHIDGFSQDIGPVNALEDREETSVDQSNYITASPLDIRTKGLSIGYQTEVSKTSSSFSNTEGVDISFIIEGELI